VPVWKVIQSAFISPSSSSIVRWRGAVPAGH
jgi:hypothetical protein